MMTTKILVSDAPVITILRHKYGLEQVSISKVNYFLTWAFTVGKMKKSGEVAIGDLMNYIVEYAEIYSKVKNKKAV